MKEGRGGIGFPKASLLQERALYTKIGTKKVSNISQGSWRPLGM